MSTYDVKSHLTNVPTVSTNTATTDSSLKKAWERCIRAEEANRMFKKLLAEGVGTEQIEWVNRGEEGRKQVVSDEVRTRILDSACRIRKLKEERKQTTNNFKKVVSNNKL